MPQGKLLGDTLAAGLYLTDVTLTFFKFPWELAHTWSLSVEEHYYILWPFIVSVLARKFSVDRIVYILAGFYVAATSWRLFCILDHQTWGLVYSRFDTRCSGLILGSCLAALRLSETASGARLAFFKGRFWNLLIGCFGFGALYSSKYYAWGDFLGLLIGVSSVECAIFLIILRCLDEGGGLVKKVLSVRPLAYVGKISYGLYLYHFPIVYYMRLNYDWPRVVLFAFPLTLLLAAGSYHWIEKPIVAWSRNKFGHRISTDQIRMV